ncbi:MAG: phosphoribosyl-ATP diphosphatase [Methanosarcinaceae archaeon]|nr:phosphoribosyl-ATP diphosphatase [Methanosarcinaceae archaeon]MDD4331053.1 phosphoribosyl-ATP diphosphatase [Methanosarcinaceae archaeon]MDD4749064.1 phosphoribosyl-ATP diphosphatase [Methanosarcinaceae archaeon]
MADADLSILNQVYDIILDRKANYDENSYVCKLLNHRKGVNKILEKVGEEAFETVLAVRNEDHDEIVYEASDLLFHLLVLLAANDVSLEEIAAELNSRHEKMKRE